MVSRANPQSVVFSHFHSHFESLTALDQIAQLALAPGAEFGGFLTRGFGPLLLHPISHRWNGSLLGLATGRLVDWGPSLHIVHILPPIDPPHLCPTGCLGPEVLEVSTTVYFPQSRGVPGLYGYREVRKYHRKGKIELRNHILVPGLYDYQEVRKSHRKGKIELRNHILDELLELIGV
jgi:hypothetical protein